MPETFVIGSVVCLRSDFDSAWPMTIASICVEGEVLLVWLDSDGEQQRMSIRPECLRSHEARKINYPEPPA